jgi:hypothetical protein
MDLLPEAQKNLNRIIQTQPWVLFVTPALAAVGFFFLHRLCAGPVRHPLQLLEARDLGEGVGTFLTVVGVIYALILGFTFQRAFSRQNELRHKLTAEASSLRNLLLLCGVMRARQRRGAIADHVRDYVEHLLEREFPAHEEPPGDTAAILYGIVPLLNEICADGIADEVDRVTLDAVYEELRSATRSRSERLTVAVRHIPRIHWFQIELLSMLIMVGFLLLDLRAPLLEALLFGMTASAISVLYLSLFDLDYPFGGLWRVEPRGLLGLQRELAHLGPAGAWQDDPRPPAAGA